MLSREVRTAMARWAASPSLTGLAGLGSSVELDSTLTGGQGGLRSQRRVGGSESFRTG